MLDIPFAFKRVDAMLYIANFDTELEYLRKFFETLEEIQMSDHDFVLDSETAENLVASTPPVVSNTVTGLPPTRKNKSNVWDFFTLEPGLEKKARCNYCGSVLKCNNGTSSMRAHANNCKSNPHSEASKRLKSTSSSMSNMTSPSLPKFDQEKCREAVVKMVVAMELPYRHVEHTAFRECMSILQPKFAPISRSTVARDALLLWDTEKTKLKYFLSHHCRSACLTTDSWTSCQNMSYMCITAHFVDNNWTLHKKILSFPQVTSYSGDSIALEVSECLNEWGLNHVMTVTVDNASANDRGIEILKTMLKLRNGLVLNGDHIHMRCCTHILNLIVKEGLKEIDDSVLRIRGAVKYDRASPSRQRKFLQYVKNRNIEYKGSVQFDRETRWNSTYDMLNAALKLQAACLEFEVKDTKYHEELNKGKGVPTTLDWQNACGISKFLEIFKNASVRISGSSYVTSNRYMPEVFSIGLTLKKMMTSTDVDSTTRDMDKRMKEKYDKYWGNHKSLNMLLLIAFVLDPSYKMKFAHWFIEQNFDALEADELKQNLELCLNNIYEEYSGGVGGTQSNFQPTQFDGLGEDPKYYYIQFLQSTGAMSSASKSELSKYLSEDLENSSTGFNILNWWKVNSSRLPILASIARDVLAIPVSTVASESAFSTGGRVIDEYRSHLTPKTVEALICTEDWLNGSPLPLPSQEDIEEIESFEQEMFSLNLDGGASSTHTTLHED